MDRKKKKCKIIIWRRII
jgi:sbcc: exonuclease SbcC